jgi:hypothetical protein
MTSIAAEDERLARELRAVGVACESVYDLVNRPMDRATVAVAEPVLLRALDWVTEWNVKEGAVRALSVIGVSRAGFERLLQEFVDPKVQGQPMYAWAVGNVLGTIASRESERRMAALAWEPRYGMSRQMIVDWLGKQGNAAFEGELSRLLADESVRLQAVHALGRVAKTSVAVSALTQLRARKDTPLARAVARAMRSIERRMAAGE